MAIRECGATGFASATKATSPCATWVCDNSDPPSLLLTGPTTASNGEASGASGKIPPYVTPNDGVLGGRSSHLVFLLVPVTQSSCWLSVLGWVRVRGWSREPVVVESRLRKLAATSASLLAT